MVLHAILTQILKNCICAIFRVLFLSLLFFTLFQLTLILTSLEVGGSSLAHNRHTWDFYKIQYCSFWGKQIMQKTLIVNEITRKVHNLLRKYINFHLVFWKKVRHQEKFPWQISCMIIDCSIFLVLCVIHWNIVGSPTGCPPTHFQRQVGWGTRFLY